MVSINRPAAAFFAFAGGFFLGFFSPSSLSVSASSAGGVVSFWTAGSKHVVCEHGAALVISPSDSAVIRAANAMPI